MNTLMNQIRKQGMQLLILVLAITAPVLLQAQAYTTNGAAKIVVAGTSNIHDWTMTSNYGTCTGTFEIDPSGNLTAVNNLSFTMTVTNLKSTKGNTMDNNAYKAMAADKYPNIKFSSSSATVKSNGGGNYTITAPGKLSISSGTKDVTLVATGKMNADKSISISGSHPLVTTDYNVKAISIMLGAIKTSANVTINYTLTMKPQ
jgi:polyisoprenoid-binding protein YceI